MSIHRPIAKVTCSICLSLANRSDQLVDMLPIDPPLLSDHSFIIADLDCTLLCRTPASYRAVRNWRALDVNAFADDFSDLSWSRRCPKATRRRFCLLQHDVVHLAGQACIAHDEACHGTSFGSLVRQRMSPDEAKNTSARTEISTNSHMRLGLRGVNNSLTNVVCSRRSSQSTDRKK